MGPRVRNRRLEQFVKPCLHLRLVGVVEQSPFLPFEIRVSGSERAHAAVDGAAARCGKWDERFAA